MRAGGIEASKNLVIVNFCRFYASSSVFFEFFFQLGVGGQIGLIGQIAQEGGGVVVLECNQDDLAMASEVSSRSFVSSNLASTVSVTASTVVSLAGIDRKAS